MYKMAVLDIDGTTLNSNGKISKLTKETITRLNEKKIPVCICTGRNIRNTLPIIKMLNIKTPFICMDGMIMYDPIENKSIFECVLPQKEMLDILDILKEENLYIEIVDKYNYIKYIKNDNLKKYNLSAVQSFKFNSIGIIKNFIWGIKYIKNLDTIYNSNEKIYQILAGGDIEDLRLAEEKIKSLNIPNLEIRNDLWGNYVYYAAKGIGKSNGVRLLCNHYKIDISEVVAIGDEMNDLDMIKAVGMGVAMGNGVDSVKKAADYITETNDNDGVAKALIKFFNL